MDTLFAPRVFPRSLEAFPGSNMIGISNSRAKTGIWARIVGGLTSRAKKINDGITPSSLSSGLFLLATARSKTRVH
eukprot:scaffold6601_cov24-Attheya_sp.AAC.1